MSAQPDFQTQIAVIDAKLTSVIDTVRQLADIVKTQQSRPSGISWREIGVTLAAVAAFYVSITQISDRAIHGHTQLLDHRLAKIEDRLAPPRTVRMIAPNLHTPMPE